MSPIASLMPEVQPATGMRKRFLTMVFVMATVLARMLARIWSDLRCASCESARIRPPCITWRGTLREVC